MSKLVKIDRLSYKDGYTYMDIQKNSASYKKAHYTKSVQSSKT